MAQVFYIGRDVRVFAPDPKTEPIVKPQLAKLNRSRYFSNPHYYTQLCYRKLDRADRKAQRSWKEHRMTKYHNS